MSGTKLGKYIVLDGIDGGGKTTIFEKMYRDFIPESNGGQFCYTREPGGTDYSEKMRELLLHMEISVESELLGFFSARVDTKVQVAMPALLRGLHVISDRSDSASYAYQIYGRDARHLSELFWSLRSLSYALPTLYIFLDLEPELAAQRMAGRLGDRFDTQSIEFFTRVRLGYKDFAKRLKNRCVFVDASDHPDTVYKNVCELITMHVM